MGDQAIGASILVIEDNKVIAEFIQLVLEEKGFKVQTAPDGEAGLAACLNLKPDLVLCDLVLPGIDGFEVIRRAAENPETTSIPFIYISAKSDRASVREGMGLGAEDYISKPFTPAEILQAVQTRLKRRRG
ncbi:MAG: response regulator [Leptospirales bacterium]|nr:response regulator [Leptospirales bacterium]